MHCIQSSHFTAQRLHGERRHGIPNISLYNLSPLLQTGLRMVDSPVNNLQHNVSLFPGVGVVSLHDWQPRAHGFQAPGALKTLLRFRGISGWKKEAEIEGHPGIRKDYKEKAYRVVGSVSRILALSEIKFLSRSHGRCDIGGVDHYCELPRARPKAS